MTLSPLIAFALASTLAVGAAWAQDPPSAPAAQHRAWDPGQMQAAMRARSEARRAERLKALHDVLNIRPDQEGAFQAFAAVLQPPTRPAGEPARAMGADRAAMAGLTTPERLDRMAERMHARMAWRQAAFERRAAAVKALYAALGPDQRRTLDALPLLRGGDRRDGHGWGEGRGERGGIADHDQG